MLLNGRTAVILFGSICIHTSMFEYVQTHTEKRSNQSEGDSPEAPAASAVASSEHCRNLRAVCVLRCGALLLFALCFALVSLFIQ